MEERGRVFAEGEGVKEREVVSLRSEREREGVC